VRGEGWSMVDNSIMKKRSKRMDATLLKIEKM
jgi:hypothetical protein